jgi:DNA-binding IclR family transcriptional regulator
MRKQGIQVISRAAAILRVCGASNAGLSLGEIAAELALPRSTVQRIVNALVTEGLLQTNGTHRSIRIGLGLHAIAVAQTVDVVELAHPFLKELSHSTGETVDLAELKSDHLVFVDQVSGSHRLRTVSSVGEIFPLHNTANGKAALSFMSDDDVLSTLRSSTKIEPANLNLVLNEIQIARQNGFAEDNDEHMEGISAVGTAFQTRTGNIFAISIPLPTVRFKSQKQQLAEMLLLFRSKIEDALNTTRP